MAKKCYTARMNAQKHAQQLRENIQRLIDSGEHSAIELAEFAGFASRQTIYDFLKGNIADLRNGNVMLLADHLGVAAEDLTKRPLKIPAKSA